MKFLIDMQLPPQLAGWLAGLAHDAVHVADVGLDRASDESILQFAREHDRIVITADLDYPRIMSHTKASDPGIVLLRGGDFDDREAESRLARVLERVREDHFEQSILVVERHRIRRRELPLRS